MAALDTVADYVNYARVLLQDQVNSPYRYPDADLLMALNMAFPEAKKLRPDLFLTVTGIPFFTAVDTTPVPWNPMYRLPIIYFMCGQAQVRDDEGLQDQRAAAFLGLFATKLSTAT
jgi:hypothetical protein